MILTILAALNQMATFGVEAVYSFMRCGRWGSGAFRDATELAICAGFDELTQHFISSKWAAVYENPLHTGAIRLRSAEVAAAQEAFIAAGENPNLMTYANRHFERLHDLAPIKKPFNIARSVFAIIGCVIAVGLAIVLTWSLVSEWDELEDSSKTFQTILVVLQWIEAALAVVVIGVCIACPVTLISYMLICNCIVLHCLGRCIILWERYCRSSRYVRSCHRVHLCCSVYGRCYVSLSNPMENTLLCQNANIGNNSISISVLVVWLVIDMQNPPKPAPSLLDNWMKDHGKVWATAHKAPPDPVQASLNPGFFQYSSDLQNVSATFSSSQEGLNAELDSITLTFTSGADHGAFFAEKKQYVERSDLTAGSVKVSGLPSSCVVTILNLPSPIAERYMNTSVTIKRGREEGESTQAFRLAYDKPIKITAIGVVKDELGHSCSMTWEVFSSEGEKSDGQIWATRQPEWRWGS